MAVFISQETCNKLSDDGLADSGHVNEAIIAQILLNDAYIDEGRQTNRLVVIVGCSRGLGNLKYLVGEDFRTRGL